MREQLSSEEATDLDRITHFACVFFHRPRFTGDIFERLDPWLRLQVPGVDLWELTLKQVADLLEEAAAPKGTARTGADGAQVEAKRAEGVRTLDDSATGRDGASYPSLCSRPAGPIERVEHMAPSALACLDTLVTQLKDDVMAVLSAPHAGRRDLQSRRLENAHRHYREIQELYLASRRQCAAVRLPPSCDYHAILQAAKSLAEDLLNYQIDDSESASETPAAECDRFSDLMRRYRSVGEGLLDLRTSCETQSSTTFLDAQPVRAEHAEGTGAGSDPAEAEQAEGIDVSDPLVSAIDDVVNFVREHRGNQPHEVLPALLMIEGRVAALCGARGIPRPSVTYLGTYGGQHTEFCRIPITQTALSVRIWWDDGWYAAMQGLRAAIAQRRPPKQPEVEQAEARRAEATGAGSGQVESEQAEGIDEQTRQEKIANLADAPRQAYYSFEAAERKAGKKLEDKEAYKLLKKEGIAEYELPPYDNWSRYLRTARQALNEQKYTRRQGRPHGGSIVRQDQIEPPDNDDR